MILQALGVAAGCTAASVVATALAIPRLRAIGIIDMPNARSSHDRPVVRGAGIAMAAVWVATAAVSLLVRGGGGSGVALLGLVGSLTLLGFVDDLRHLPPGVRLLAQLAICAGAVSAGLGATTLLLPHGVIALGAVALPIWTLVLAAVVNFFNFMDGIDGLAAGQTLASACVIALVGMAMHTTLLVVLAAALVGTVAGFLPFNWHPAHCFMGDAGSYFCGSCVVGLALLGQRQGVSPVLILLPAIAFMLDAGVTIACRVVRGELPWTAHKDHVYQRLVRRGWSHARVATGYIALAVALGALDFAYVVPTWR